MTSVAPAVPESRWTTPRKLRAFVAAAWVTAGLLFAVGLQALNADRAALHDVLRESWGEVAAGELTSAAASLAELRAAR